MLFDECAVCSKICLVLCDSNNFIGEENLETMLSKLERHEWHNDGQGPLQTGLSFKVFSVFKIAKFDNIHMLVVNACSFRVDRNSRLPTHVIG